MTNTKFWKKRKIIFSLISYVFIFIGISFVLTCSIVLFLEGSPLPENFIRTRAPRTFSNIFILSFIFTYIVLAIKYYTFDKKIDSIRRATKELARGNYKYKIYTDLKVQDGSHSEMDFLIEDINKISQQFVELENLQTSFLSNVSHEIKTPITIIKNYSHLLEDENLGLEERKNYCKIISDSIEKLNSLVTNILKLNKLENQKIVLECTAFDLADFLGQTLLNFESIWEEKNISIDINLEENIFINTDKNFLEIVCNNLISNALKFTEPRGKVYVSCYKESNFVAICIQDTGCGISKETGKHIFEKFYQGDTSHKEQGNGLGLALVKRVIDIMQGEISVESVVGKGTTFTVRIRRV